MDFLSTLRSEKQRRLLDTALRLHDIGLASVLEFPQIVVTGDQSAGKSSVLEAVSGVNYPRREGMCTRFAIEMALKEAEDSPNTARIIPYAGSNRSTSELQKLHNFHETIEDLSVFPEIVEKATRCMGLSDDNGTRGPRSFSRDVLRVEISGPQMPQLYVSK